MGKKKDVGTRSPPELALPWGHGKNWREISKRKPGNKGNRPARRARQGGIKTLASRKTYLIWGGTSSKWGVRVKGENARARLRGTLLSSHRDQNVGGCFLRQNFTGVWGKRGEWGGAGCCLGQERANPLGLLKGSERKLARGKDACIRRKAMDQGGNQTRREKAKSDERQIQCEPDVSEEGRKGGGKEERMAKGKGGARVGWPVRSKRNVGPLLGELEKRKKRHGNKLTQSSIFKRQGKKGRNNRKIQLQFTQGGTNAKGKMGKEPEQEKKRARTPPIRAGGEPKKKKKKRAKVYRLSQRKKKKIQPKSVSYPAKTSEGDHGKKRL